VPDRLTASDALRLKRCVAQGGVALIPTDTVYGLACDPQSEAAVGRLYALKGTPAARPAAVMFFSLEGALEALPELGQREQGALRALLPGPVTVLLPNRAGRFLLACGPEPHSLGLRVPALPAGLSALAALERPLMQSSANLSGGPEARRAKDVSPQLRRAIDLELDGGELPGLASTVLDLRAYEDSGGWRIVRAGPLTRAHLAEVLC
jgi:L-threonylcarbamoyladenylate synthase